MQPLPDELKNSVDVSSQDFETETSQYELINAGEREQASRYAPKKALPSVGVIAIAVALSLIVNIVLVAATTDKPLTKIAALFGLQTKSDNNVDTQQLVIDQLNSTVISHTDLLTQSHTSIKAVGEYLADIKANVAEIDSKVVSLERRYEEIVNEINRLKIQRAAPKPIAITKPKEQPKPQIFVSLVSIRHQGGNSWITLREGLDTSPLMAIGDEWRAVKLISADTNNKSAQLMINGTLTVVKL